MLTASSDVVEAPDPDSKWLMMRSMRSALEPDTLKLSRSRTRFNRALPR